MPAVLLNSKKDRAAGRADLPNQPYHLWLGWIGQGISALMPRAYLSTSVVVMQVWLDASRLPVQSGFHDFKQSRCGRGSAPLAVVGRAPNRPAPHIKAAPLTRRRAACLPRKMFCISSTFVGFLVMLTVHVVPITRRALRNRDPERVATLFALANFLYGGASNMYFHVLTAFRRCL